MHLNRRMIKENVVHLHNGVLIRGKKNDILKCVNKGMKLGIVIPTEVSKTQKTWHGMYSFISGHKG